MTHLPADVRELTVGQLAARSGVAVSALHFYEARGLITSRRTAGNQRRYHRDVLRRVAFIRASQRVGIPLRTIKESLDQLAGSRTPTRPDWARLSAAWRDDLDKAGVAAEVSIDTNDGEVALHDADNDRLGLVAEYPHPTLGRMRQFGTLIDFSETPTGPYGPAPMLGQHTRPLMVRLGYSTEEIDDLLARGIIYETTEDYRFAQ